MATVNSIIEDLEHEIDRFNEKLIRFKKAQRDGKQLTEHYFDRHDKEIWIYCSKCKDQLDYLYSQYDIPFEEDAICDECRRTPEERAAEEKAEQERQRERELGMLAYLREKYDGQS